MNQPTLLFTRDRMADRVPALIQTLSGRGCTRALQWSYKQADRAKLEIVRVTRRIVRAA